MLMFLLTTVESHAQFKSAVIGIDGLTCSACSFATEKSLRKVESIDSIYMLLEENTATVFFKKSSKVNMNEIARKVVDAGFSVRSVTALLHMDSLTITPDYCWNYENDVYHFIKMDTAKVVNGDVRLLFIGDKFMSSKAFKKWKMYAKNTCATAVSQAPYSQNYDVTIQ